MRTCRHFTNISICQCLECIQTNRWISRGHLREVFCWYLGWCACVCVAACPPTLFTSVPMKILFTCRTLFNDCFWLLLESGCFSWSPPKYCGHIHLFAPSLSRSAHQSGILISSISQHCLSKHSRYKSSPWYLNSCINNPFFFLGFFTHWSAGALHAQAWGFGSHTRQ